MFPFHDTFYSHYMYTCLVISICISLNIALNCVNVFLYLFPLSLFCDRGGNECFQVELSLTDVSWLLFQIMCRHDHWWIINIDYFLCWRLCTVHWVSNNILKEEQIDCYLWYFWGNEENVWNYLMNYAPFGLKAWCWKSAFDVETFRLREESCMLTWC